MNSEIAKQRLTSPCEILTSVPHTLDLGTLDLGTLDLGPWTLVQYLGESQSSMHLAGCWLADALAAAMR